MKRVMHAGLLTVLGLCACSSEKAATQPDQKPSSDAPAAAPAPAPTAAPAPAPVAGPTEGVLPGMDPVAAKKDGTGSFKPAPKGIYEVEDPPTNKNDPKRAALGYTLFFDKRLSKDSSMACVACHLPDHGWANKEALSAKVGGAKNKRHSPTVLNLAYHAALYWDGRMPSLEAVSNAAWKGQLGADPAEVAGRLNQVPAYKERFNAAYGSDATAENIPMALASFLRTLKSANAPYDRYSAGDKTALSEPAKRGLGVFQMNGCMVCHMPPLFTDGRFHNVGVGSGKPEAEQDMGRMDHTKSDADKGKFKTPTLRDIARTAPYLHDGSAATLEDAINFMAAGELKNPSSDPLLAERKLSANEKADLKAFLEALSGENTYTSAPTDIPQ